MLTQENLIVFLYALPVYQLLFYTVQLITFRKAYPSRKSLGLLLLLMTMVLIMNAIHHFGYDRLMAVLFIFFTPLLLCLLPVFHRYLSTLTGANRQNGSLSRLGHYIIPIIGFGMSLFTFGMLTLNERLMIITGINPPDGGSGAFAFAAWDFKWILPILLIVQLIVSFVKASRLLHQERLATRQDPGRFAYLQVRWILIIASSLILFIMAIVLPFLFPAQSPVSGALLANVILLLTGGIIGYYGMKQDALLVQVSSLGREQQASPEASGPPIQHVEQKAAPSASSAAPLVADEEARRIISQLHSMMQAKKPYTDARYSLGELCGQMEIPRRIMTYVLNDVMGKNFYGVVNEYRLREAIQIMETSGRKYTIEAIAEMVGFNSKSSFYACFKKFTGMSPKEYLEKK
ncbi:MAG TPA: helix-turn-helix domain-containing protein [Bacteroidales bacterium]|nr:helix-turn-helix domain-containing protein [Bacteroidales bacterium]